MTLETMLAIIAGIFTVVCGIGYIYFKNNTYIRPKKYRIERYMK